MTTEQNRVFVLKSRPDGLPEPQDFQLLHRPLPEVAEGRFLVRNEMLGLAPASRIRMSPGRSYAEPTPIGGTIYGQTLGTVTVSAHPGYSVGDRVVLTDGGWQTHTLSDGSLARKIDESRAPASVWLGALGVSGCTAYVGLVDVGHLTDTDSVLVSAASGGVGSVAGQIARARGCRVIGIAGGAEKCAFVRDGLKFDDCIDYRADDFEARLAEASNGGIDLFFDNVGGAVLRAALRNMADFGRVVVCGMISQYNDPDEAPGPSWRAILTRRLTVRGFLMRDHGHLFERFEQDMARWYGEGRIVVKEDITDGFENTPQAFIDMLSGRNFGKTLVRI